jgi:hypothetical protein
MNEVAVGWACNPGEISRWNICREPSWEVDISNTGVEMGRVNEIDLTETGYEYVNWLLIWSEDKLL